VSKTQKKKEKKKETEAGLPNRRSKERRKKQQNKGGERVGTWLIRLSGRKRLSKSSKQGELQSSRTKAKNLVGTGREKKRTNRT